MGTPPGADSKSFSPLQQSARRRGAFTSQVMWTLPLGVYAIAVPLLWLVQVEDPSKFRAPVHVISTVNIVFPIVFLLFP